MKLEQRGPRSEKRGPRAPLLASRFSLLLATALSACHGPSSGLSAVGTIEVTETDIAPDIGGRLVELRAREGAMVRAGDTLAVLAAPTMPADIQRQEATVADAKAGLADLLAGARPEELARAEADVRRAQADADLARANRVRIEPLAAAGTLPAQRGDEARSAEAQADARLAAAKESLRQLRNGPRAELVAAARARVAQAEAALASQLARAGELVLVSPGVLRVRGTWYEPGELVPAGRPVLTLADDTRPWVRVFLDQDGFAQVKPGTRAVATLDPSGPDIPAEVVALSDKAEYTPRVALTENERADLTFWVKVALADTSGRAKAGLPVTVRFGTKAP